MTDEKVGGGEQVKCDCPRCSNPDYAALSEAAIEISVRHNRAMAENHLAKMVSELRADKDTTVGGAIECVVSSAAMFASNAVTFAMQNAGLDEADPEVRQRTEDLITIKVMDKVFWHVRTLLSKFKEGDLPVVMLRADGSTQHVGRAEKGRSH